jgi:Glycoside Hydrolase Family 113/PEP-CTERM motif
MRSIGRCFFIAAGFAFLTFSISQLAFANPIVYEPATDPAVGTNLISWYNDVPNNTANWQGQVQKIYNAGLRSVSISPVWYLDLTTGVVAPDATKSPDLSAIAAGISKAKSLGMTVTVNPFFEPVNFSMFRGNFNPTPGSAIANTFWPSYQSYLSQVATIAQANGADRMTVGTEYNGLDNNAGNQATWTSVINAVDAIFTGKLGYASNYTNYNLANTKANIWDNPKIDFLGTDAYFTDVVSGLLGGGTGTGSAARNAADSSDTYNTAPYGSFTGLMKAAWAKKLDTILTYAAALHGGTGLPVQFTEIGYLPFNRTSNAPQATTQPLDTAEQIAAYNGLIQALDGKKSVFSEFDVWQWGIQGADGSNWNLGLDNPALYYQIPQIPAGSTTNTNLALTQFLSNYTSHPAPEPSTLVLLVVGAVGCAAAARRRNRS